MGIQRQAQCRHLGIGAASQNRRRGSPVSAGAWTWRLVDSGLHQSAHRPGVLALRRRRCSAKTGPLPRHACAHRIRRQADCHPSHLLGQRLQGECTHAQKADGSSRADAGRVHPIGCAAWWRAGHCRGHRNGCSGFAGFRPACGGRVLRKRAERVPLAERYRAPGDLR